MLGAVGSGLRERSGRFPEWDDADLAPLVPDPEARAALLGVLARM